MSISLIPVFTLAGLQAVFNTANNGLQARITHVALGDEGWAPDNQATQLRNERNRVPVSNGERLQPTQIHLTAVENGSLDYWVREVGFFLDDGTLLAIWSDPDQALAWKAAEVDLLLAFDLVLSALPADSVVVDGTGGLNLAPATAAKEGVVRLATQEEALAGSVSSAVVMTPANSRQHGDARYARLGHHHLWEEIDNPPATYASSAHRHPWSDLDNLPAAFPPAAHRHGWSEIDGKPATYPPASHRHSWSQIDNKPTTYPPSGHRHTWNDIDNKPSTYPPAPHSHDVDYIRPANLRVTSGLVRTTNRYSLSGWNGHNDFNRNFVDIFPPSGFSIVHLQGFIASVGVVFFGGTVNGDDTLWARWEQRSDRVRVICANSENRPDTTGAGSYVNYLAIWRR